MAPSAPPGAGVGGLGGATVAGGAGGASASGAGGASGSGGNAAACVVDSDCKLETVPANCVGGTCLGGVCHFETLDQDRDQERAAVCAPVDLNQSITRGTDCNDNDATVHSRAIEACNGVDDDCNGLNDVQKPKTADGTELPQTLTCVDGDWFVTEWRWEGIVSPPLSDPPGTSMPGQDPLSLFRVELLSLGEDGDTWSITLDLDALSNLPAPMKNRVVALFRENCTVIIECELCALVALSATIQVGGTPFLLD
jgi:hypothetical protein